jgi:hypothetical protein
MDTAALVDLLAVTQQWYYDFKPIATQGPYGLVPDGSLQAFTKLERQAQKVLGKGAYELLPSLVTLTEQDEETSEGWLRYLPALQWLSALHAYMLNRLPPEEEKTRQRMGLGSSEE